MKILVYIEREKLQTKVISILARQGYHLFVTKYGEKAWRFLLNEESRPDLVVMYMPQEEDVEFLKKKHNIIDLAAIPIIFLLEKGTKEREEKLNAKVKHGHWSYLCLPVNTEEFVKRVELMAGFHSQPGRLEETLFFDQLIRQIEDSQKTKRVLLVEALAKRQEPLKRLLENEGYEVIGCTSSQTAWTRLVRTRPDLVIWSTCFEGEFGWNQFIANKAMLPEHKNIPILYFVRGERVELEEINDWSEETKWRAISFSFTAEEFFEAITYLLSLPVTG